MIEWVDLLICFLGSTGLLRLIHVFGEELQVGSREMRFRGMMMFALDEVK